MCASSAATLIGHLASQPVFRLLSRFPCTWESVSLSLSVCACLCNCDIWCSAAGYLLLEFVDCCW